MIYTSYFANIRKLDKQYTNLISIARKSPDWFKGREYKKLSPSWNILSEYKNSLLPNKKKIYTRRFYNEIIFPLDSQINIIIEELGENPVLLCYEKPSDFCHRFLVSYWMIKRGFNVQEL